MLCFMFQDVRALCRTAGRCQNKFLSESKPTKYFCKKLEKVFQQDK